MKKVDIYNNYYNFDYVIDTPNNKKYKQIVVTLEWMDEDDNRKAWWEIYGIMDNDDAEHIESKGNELLPVYPLNNIDNLVKETVLKEFNK